MAKDPKETKVVHGVDPSLKGTRTDSGTSIPEYRGSEGQQLSGSAQALLHSHHRDPSADLNLQQARAEVQRLQEQVNRLDNENRTLRQERASSDQRIAAEQGRRLDADASARRRADELNAAHKDEKILNAGEILRPLLEGDFANVTGVIIGHGKDERHTLYKLSREGTALKLEHVTGPRTTSWSETREELERLVDNHLTPADRR